MAENETNTQQKQEQQEKPRKKWLTWGRLGWLIALLILVVFLIYAAVVGNRLERAEAIPAQLEAKLHDAVSFEAQQTLDYTQQIQIALGQQNWGSAADNVQKIRAIIDTMDRIAPKGVSGQVSQAEEKLVALEEAIRERYDDARDKLDEFTDAVAPLAAR